MISLFEVWLCLPVRYTILNLSRFGHYCEKSIRLHMEGEIDFPAFNKQLIERSCSSDLIAVFDPFFIPKAGKCTEGLGQWLSGAESKSKKGLEFSCLAVVDLDACTAMPLKGVQTPCRKDLDEKCRTLVDHYVSVIKEQADQVTNMTKYLVVDGYFMKKEFIIPMMALGLYIITKMRPDANLKYLYTGLHKPGKGRPKLYGDKIDCYAIDKRRIREFIVDNDAIYYSGVVYARQLKKKVRIVYIEHREMNRHEILLSTDTDLCPKLILKYYRLRFQIEFLFREAKQYTGLEHCQARSKNKLEFHFNMSLSSKAIAKATYWLKNKPVSRGPFSMKNIKSLITTSFLQTEFLQT